MRNSVIFSLLIALVLGVRFARADDPELKNRWGTTVSDDEAKQAVHFNPLRIMNRTYDSFLHFGIGAVDLLKFRKKGHFSDATYQFAESFLDPFDLTNSILSDAGAAIKSPRYIGRRMSTRIQVCTGNLGLILDNDEQKKYAEFSWILDVDHVGVLVDGDEAFTDPGGGGLDEIEAEGGADCSAVPIMSNEPEEVAIQRLRYIAPYYWPKYDFGTANCGYFTRDVLNASGFAYPIFPNAGIGTEYAVTAEQIEFKQRRQSDLKNLHSLMADTDAFLNNLRTIFAELENGSAPDVTLNTLENLVLTPDAFFQMIISATRGKNTAAQTWVLNDLTPAINARLELWGQLKHNGSSKAGKKLYRDMMGELKAEDLQWFTKNMDPNFQKIVTDTLNKILL